MIQYQELLRRILEEGNRRGDRTGTGTISLFGPQMEFDLQRGFPLMTTKRVFWRGVVEELLWMLRGETNVKPLWEKGVNIWNSWADINGDVGPVYGHAWRKFLGPFKSKTDGRRYVYGESLAGDSRIATMSLLEGFDQITDVIDRIRKTPEDRRLVVTAWNPLEIKHQGLPPCHCFFQFYVRDDYLDCKMYQRSADMFLGVPFNIASYAALTTVIAFLTNLRPGRFIHTFGDAHIYLNHIEQVNEQLSRKPGELPRLLMADRGQACVEDFQFEDFTLVCYHPQAAIKGEVSV